MEYLGKNIHKLGFGFMRLPMLGQDVDMEQTIQMVDLFMAKGGSYFDTSWGYLGGKSEEALKTALVDRYPRERFQIATKCPAFAAKSAEEARGMIQTSLRRLGVDFIDFYLLHNVSASRVKFFDDYGMWDYLSELKASGIVRHVGFSMHDSGDMLDELLTEHPEMEFVQFQMNYGDWESSSIQSRKCYEAALRHRKPIVVMEPLRGGSLANPPESVRTLLTAANPEVSPASWGIRFAASHENIITVLSGMSTLEQMEDNVSFMEHFQPLSPEEFAVLDEAREAIARIPAIPCTACGYCLEGCPQGISIPGIFAAYNRKLVYDDHETALGLYRLELITGNKASDCVACGNCEQVCPQHVDVIDSLKLVADDLEQYPLVFG